jgi:chromosome segregation ATPase
VSRTVKTRVSAKPNTETQPAAPRRSAGARKTAAVEVLLARIEECIRRIVTLEGAIARNGGGLKSTETGTELPSAIARVLASSANSGNLTLLGRDLAAAQGRASRLEDDLIAARTRVVDLELAATELSQRDADRVARIAQLETQLSEARARRAGSDSSEPGAERPLPEAD